MKLHMDLTLLIYFISMRYKWINLLILDLRLQKTIFSLIATLHQLIRMLLQSFLKAIKNRLLGVPLRPLQIIMFDSASAIFLKNVKNQT